MSYQRTAGLSDQQLFDEFDREFAAIEEENGGGCTSQEIVDWARRHPKSLLYELFDWKKGVTDEYRVMQWETTDLMLSVPQMFRLEPLNQLV